MIKNALIIHYDNDKKLNTYFSQCAENAKILLNMKEHIKQTEVKNNNCNKAYLDLSVFPKISEKSLFLIYSHGTENSFCKIGEHPFIEDTINCDQCLDGSLIYTNACLTAQKFGKNITNKNASFYGYDKEIKISPEETYQRDFIHCDNYGLFTLIQGKTLKEAKIEAKQQYTN